MKTPRELLLQKHEAAQVPLERMTRDVVRQMAPNAMAASPRVSGGILSIASMVLGLFGLGASVLGMIGVIIF